MRVIIDDIATAHHVFNSEDDLVAAYRDDLSLQGKLMPSHSLEHLLASIAEFLGLWFATHSLDNLADRRKVLDSRRERTDDVARAEAILNRLEAIESRLNTREEEGRPREALTLEDIASAGSPVTIILETAAEARLAAILTEQTPGAVVIVADGKDES